MLENINLFNGLTEKMAYLTQRQRTLAQNLSNADTPGFSPSDVKAPDFAKTLRTAEGAGVSLSMATTQGNHIPHRMQVGEKQGAATVVTPNGRTYEVSPTGNAVDLEEQMMLSSRNNMDYQLITNLYGKNMDQLRNAMRRTN